MIEITDNNNISNKDEKNVVLDLGKLLEQHWAEIAQVMADRDLITQETNLAPEFQHKHTQI